MAPVDALGVLDGRVSVCEGYSNLPAALLRSLDIPAKVVGGWTRCCGDIWADVLRHTPYPDHAWNEVFVDGRWVLMDTTWDAGYIEGDTFIREVSWEYFDPDPEAFTEDHSTIRPRIELQR